MEQNILKRYNEIHIKLWEEVLKVFDDRTDKGFEEFKTNIELLDVLYLSDLKRQAVLNLFSKGYITESEQSRLLANANCSACYIAREMYYVADLTCFGSLEKGSCMCCPIPEWREQGRCDDYSVLNECIHELRMYVIKCINGKKEFNQQVYTRLRMDIKRKMYNISSLEWGYEENEK